MPMSGVMIDWCAPPSGANEMPEGVATTMKAGHQDVPVDDVIIEKAEIVAE